MLLQEQPDDCLVTTIRRCLERAAVHTSLHVDIRVLLEENPDDCLETTSRRRLERVAVLTSSHVDVRVFLQEPPRYFWQSSK